MLGVRIGFPEKSQVADGNDSHATSIVPPWDIAQATKGATKGKTPLGIEKVLQNTRNASMINSSTGANYANRH
ncbi:hypothetical protein AZSP09_36910 (plasmid) [Azospira sp. I09]|nr:hypothetical protein AZSP09_36910 [Azospira sp. I09]